MNKDVNNSNTSCERCGNAIVCMPEDISNCQCSLIGIDKAEYNYINSKFKHCLCNNCIRILKEEYHFKAHE